MKNDIDKARQTSRANWLIPLIFAIIALACFTTKGTFSGTVALMLTAGLTSFLLCVTIHFRLNGIKRIKSVERKKEELEQLIFSLCYLPLVAIFQLSLITFLKFDDLGHNFDFQFAAVPLGMIGFIIVFGQVHHRKTPETNS